MSGGMTVTGIAELDRKLESLPQKARTKCLRPALSQALTIEVKAIKAAAPVGKTGALKRSIGKRIKFKRDGTIVAKAGINVGSRTKASKLLKAAGVTVKSVGRSAYMSLHNTVSGVSPHGHLVALGTKQRTTKSGANRGVMPPNPFVRRAAASVQSSVLSKIESVVRTNLDKEITGS